jgi:CCR4-NOT complex subunit CAF16
MGLMGNWDVLLLDEVTVDLDALVRAELLAFLVKESKERGATIVCEFGSASKRCSTVPSSLALLARSDLIVLNRSRAPSSDATHIYDHIETFPTHICHLRLGRTPDELVTYTPSSTIMEDSVAAEEKRGELLGIALKWLRDDRDVRKQRDKERGTERGAKRQGDVSLTSISDHAAFKY